MRKIFVLIAILLLALPVFAGPVNVQEDGTTVGGSFANTINFIGGVSVSGDYSTKDVTISGGLGGLQTINTDATTPTLSASTAGTVYVSDVTRTYTLPSAVTGYEYVFVATTMNPVSVDPANTGDTIRFLGLDAGDKITSTLSYDSVTLTASDSATWVIRAITAGWQDGG